jgi:hypothetical protein
MTTNKELAVAYRKIAYLYESIGKDAQARVNRNCADELDPPQPEYPDGTAAWVTNQYGRRYLCTWHAENREWCIGGPDGDSAPGKVTKVEPLRVLADDEIAIKCGVSRARDWRDHADHARQACPMAAGLCAEMAAALDAEAGEQS